MGRLHMSKGRIPAPFLRAIPTMAGARVQARFWNAPEDTVIDQNRTPANFHFFT
jgi:hypothetical protein